MSDSSDSTGAKTSAYCKALAEELGIDTTDLARALDHCGISLWGSREGLISSLDSVTRSDRIRQLIDAGKSGGGIAKELGVSPQRVYQIFHDLDLYEHYREVRTKDRVLREEKEKTVKEKEKHDRELRRQESSSLWLRGVSIRVIAEKFGITRKCMCSRISEYRKRYPDMFPVRRVRKKKDAVDKAG